MLLCTNWHNSLYPQNLPVLLVVQFPCLREWRIPSTTLILVPLHLWRVLPACRMAFTLKELPTLNRKSFPTECNCDKIPQFTSDRLSLWVPLDDAKILEAVVRVSLWNEFRSFAHNELPLCAPWSFSVSNFMMLYSICNHVWGFSSQETCFRHFRMQQCRSTFCYDLD